MAQSRGRKTTTAVHIVLDCTPLETGHRTRGVGRYVRGLLAGLASLDLPYRWTLITYGAAERRGGPRGARWVRLARPRLGRLTALVTHQLLLPALLRRLRPDLMHFPCLSAHLSVTGVSAWAPTPFVVTVHDFTPLHMPALLHGQPLNHWWYARQRAWARRAARLICVSRATREEATRVLNVPTSRCPVVYEGVDRALFHPDPSPRSEPPTILFVGGDHPNKNRGAVVAAFARLCRVNALPHQLVLVGPDARPDAALAEEFPGLDLSRVRRLQSVEDAALAQLYRQADLFVFPSRDEGFGLPVLEAMASGTPVITSTVSSLPEVAGEAALLVDPDDIDGLAAAMERVLCDRSLWETLQQKGLRRAAQFTWQAAAERTARVYAEALQ